MHILIPCKGLETGKSRLSACLGRNARRELCAQLLDQTLTRAVALAAPDHVHVVTPDPSVALLAQRHATATLPDRRLGLNAALNDARCALLASGSAIEALLILPIDLPFATADAIRAASSCRDDLVIAADEAGSGTNLMLLRGAALQELPFRYGPESYAAHIGAGRASGFSIHALRDWRLAFDIDDAAQYARWLTQQATIAG